jgi:hypothetical protein
MTGVGRIGGTSGRWMIKIRRKMSRSDGNKAKLIDFLITDFQLIFYR